MGRVTEQLNDVKMKRGLQNKEKGFGKGYRTSTLNSAKIPAKLITWHQTRVTEQRNEVWERAQNRF